MAYIEERGGGWSVRWRDAAGPHRKQCPDKKTAERLRQEIERCHALGERWRSRNDAPTPRLRDVFDAYLDEMELSLAPATVVQRRLSLRYFLEYLRTQKRQGGLLPELLTKAALTGYFRWLRDERDNGELSCKNRLSHVMAAWEWAWQDERFEEQVPKPRRIKLPSARPKVGPTKRTWADLARVIEACGVKDMYGRVAGGWYADLFTVQYYTGLRSSQALQLEWRDVDLDTAELTVRPELGKSRQEQAGRVVPISPHLVEALKGWGRRDGERYLVRIEKDKREVVDDTLRSIWERAGMPDERQPTHVFRKVLVSELGRQGVLLEIRSALVGHSTGTTGDVYTAGSALFEQMREAVALIPKVGTAAPANELDARRRAREQAAGDGAPAAETR